MDHNSEALPCLYNGRCGVQKTVQLADSQHAPLWISSRDFFEHGAIVVRQTPVQRAFEHESPVLSVRRWRGVFLGGDVNEALQRAISVVGWIGENLLAAVTI